MKLWQIIDNTKALNDFIAKDKEMPFKALRAIAQNIRTMRAECEIFEKARVKCVKGYEEKSDDEKLAINEKIKEMLETEIDIAIQYIGVDDISTCTLSAKDYIALEYMIHD